jgi:hypothetical protein
VDDDRVVIIPLHGELVTGTHLRSIIRQPGLTSKSSSR